MESISQIYPRMTTPLRRELVGEYSSSDSDEHDEPS
jgi:hypothetical protein